ncbi:MAG TPA: nucleotide sugar dehydrogenase [Candidatus Baltobacteraceae bacterium]|nr:nucleotide sugar dehydrogenase [Candidatus Baltobacteraceae bacterium]
MRVCVQGLGYIGLPTAAMMALGGHDVVGYDVDRRVLDALRDGAHHVKEEPVRALVLAALNGGRLTLSTEVPGDADAHVICVPTPTIDHKPDLSYVRAAARATAPHLRPGDLVILESTVPPGTMDRVVVPALREAGVDPDTIAVAHCPERVIPGAIVRELRGNARVVGGRKPGDAERAADLYRSFCDGEIHVTDNVTAELVKVVENTYRDVNIAFANELALLSEELGVDAHEAIALANKHPRVNILAPGPGVGGHCIPVDPHFLSNANPFVTELIQTARRINERMPHVVARRIAELSPPHEGSRVAILGAAYKANVDDTRESPTERVEELLHERGYATRVFDPVADRWHVPLAASLEDAARGCDAVVLMVGHDAFAEIDPVALGALCRRRVLVDTRGFFDRDRWEDAGFEVHVLGGGRRGARRVAAAS